MGQLFTKIGVLNKGTFKKVTRSDLVAGFLGQTAIKTKDVIAKFNVSPKKKGKFFAVFYPGEYSIEISNEDCKTYTTDLIIIDKNNRGDLLNKDFTLVPNKIAEPIEDKSKKDTTIPNKGNKKPANQQKKN
jgi:hypothetical protein